MKMDSSDEQLLSILQVAFPLEREPYQVMGSRLGFDEEQVIEHIVKLKNGGVVRQISPVFDARRLGYSATLAVMKVPENRLGEAAKYLAEHPKVSHGYERDHYYNLWFTLSISPGDDIEREIKKIGEYLHAESAFDLPALRLFKIGAYFGVRGDNMSEGIETSLNGALPTKAELSAMDKIVINEVQQDLPLIRRPFNAMAAELNMDEDEFLSQCRSLLQRGIMRRYGAAVNHRMAGFNANAMACWRVGADMIDAASRQLVSLREVSHCYERKTNSLWPYNLFAMIHGHSRDVCQEIACRVSETCGLDGAVLLFSTKEFKKTRVIYRV